MATERKRAAGSPCLIHSERSFPSARKREPDVLTQTNLHHAGGRRAAGALLHLTSLPGLYGVGDLGDELIAFLDWAASAGLHIWQVLPLNPPGYGHSPYGCLSS